MKTVWRVALCVASLATGGTACADPAVISYREMCDASAAVALDKDHFIVGDDEMNVLRIYRRGQPSSVAQTDLSKFLDTKPDKESDLEGAARVGTIVYWISSHGTNSEGKIQERRRKFFATEIDLATSTPTVRPVGKPYGRLVQNLAADPKLAVFKLADAAAKAPKTAGALNIEGLADGGDGSLLIAFRNPLPAGKALVVPLLNPRELIDGKAEALFGEPIQLDLNGRGIRSIDRVGDAYLLVAGAIDGGGDFQLFRWGGKDAGNLQIVDAPALSGLFPEALFAVPKTGEIQILSDDGTVAMAGGECKDVPRKDQSFRSVTLKP